MLKKTRNGYSRTPNSLKEELATKWSMIDGFLVGLTVGALLGGLLINYFK